MLTIEQLREASHQVLTELAAKRDPVETLRDAAVCELMRAAENLGDALDRIERVLADLEDAEGILTYLADPGDAAVAIAMEAEEVPGGLGWVLDRLVELQDGVKEVRNTVSLAYSIVEDRLESITKGGGA